MTGRTVNELMRIFNKYPDKLRPYVYDLPINRNFPCDSISDYMRQTDKPSWSEWERNPNLSLDYIKSKHITEFNHWRGNLIIQNPNITLDYIKDNQNFINWQELSYNPSLNIDWILTFPNRDWNWGVISANPNITPEIILSQDFPWDWYHVSRNPSVSMEFIESNPNLKWDNYTIGLNPNIDIIHMKKMISRGVSGNECGMLSSESVSIESLISLLKNQEGENWLRKHFEKVGTNYKSISLNPNMTLQHIRWLELEEIEMGIKILDWEYLSRNPNLKLEWIESYPDKEWNWHTIAANKFQRYWPKINPMNKTLQEEIRITAQERQYRPEGSGYLEAKGDFYSHGFE